MALGAILPEMKLKKLKVSTLTKASPDHVAARVVKKPKPSPDHAAARVVKTLQLV